MLPVFASSRVRLSLLAGVALLAGCAGGDSSSSGPTAPPKVPPIAPAPVAPGILSLASSGLPEGLSPQLQVTGPLPGATFSRTTTGSVVWTDIPAGRYAVAIRPVRGAAGTFAGAPASLEVDVPAGGPLSTVTAVYRAVPSALAVSATGLPATATPTFTVTPPNGSPAAVAPATVVLAPQLPSGSNTPDVWRVTAAEVSAEGARFTPTPAAFDTVVSFGDTARVAVRYTIATGALAVAVGGLPASLAAAVQVVGPGDFSRTLTATTTLTGLTPGAYRVISTPVATGGITYRPATDTITVDVIASLVAAPAPVVYVAQVGRLAVTVNGLPDGAAAALTLAGAGLTRTLASSATLDSLPAGSYTLSAASVTAGPDRYAATPASQTIAVTVGTTVSAAATYQLASGSLAVSVLGLPAGLAGEVVVSGPGAFTRTVTSTATLAGLLPGRYTVTARTVRSATEAFGLATGTRTVDVTASATPATVAMTYVLVPTVVDVLVSGLPGSANAAIAMVDPSGESYAITTSQRVLPARPGRWRYTASMVTTGTASYQPAPASHDTSVTAGDTLRFAVEYTITTGSLALVVTGLPNGVAGAVNVTGPDGFARTATGTVTFTKLVPGSYTVSATAVTASGTTHVPTPATQTVTVIASTVAAGATVSYAAPTGAVNIAASGLPGGAVPTFTLTSGSSTRTATGTGTVSGLAVGTWTVTPATVSSGGTTYTATPASASVTISANSTASTSFTYASNGGGGGGGGGAGVNYRIAHVYITQAIQKLDGSVPLVANRDALLRVFVVASAANSARPEVRVRLYDGTTLLQTTVLTAPEASVRTAVAEGTLGSTWNLSVPGATVRPALRVLVDLDPTQAVPDADRADNSWPATGTPQAIAVSSVPAFTVRFVPVITGAQTGNVSSGNREQFLTSTRRLFPLRDVVSDVRAPFTSSATELQANDGNGQWLTVLNEINVLRTTDGAPSTTHYYGVVKVNYTSGIAGYGYLPGRAAIGWDYLPSGDLVAAHEWGHNFSRGHAPCGVSGDPGYPYAGGVIGQWGWNSATNTLVSPSATDLMGYCNNNWISDYTWSAVLQHRSGSGTVASARGQGATRQAGLLVWGRVVNGAIQLEPAFRVSAPITPAAVRATHRLTLLDADDRPLLQLPLEAALVDHTPSHEERQFAVVVPWSAALEDGLAAIRVSDARVPVQTTVRRSLRPSAAPGVPRLVADPDPDASLVAETGRVRVNWRNGGFAMGMVRDAATGEVMGFVRRSGASVATGGRAVEVVFSDGVRSAVKR
ncbi:MAG: hypothetical protein ACK5ZZ_12005 [Gemmatimonadaceae bacterium]